MEHRVHVVGAVVGGVGGVLAVSRRRDDPRHLRQGAAVDVVDERRQHVGGVRLAYRRRSGRALPGHDRPADRQLAGAALAAVRAVVLLVEPERVVAVVPEEIIGIAAAITYLMVGVNAPADPGRLEQFRVSGDLGSAGVGPEVDLVVVRVRGPAAGRTGPEVHPVGAGGCHDRLVVAVADRECVGERVLEGDVVAREVPHRLFGLGRHPVVPRPVVPGLVVAVPAVVEVRVGLVGEVVWQQVAQVGAVHVRLLEDRPAVLVSEDLLVPEAAHAAERAEVVVEGPVLLHQDHHVLQVLDRPGQVLARRDRGGPRLLGGAADIQSGGDRGRRAAHRGGVLKEPAPGERGHRPAACFAGMLASGVALAVHHVSSSISFTFVQQRERSSSAPDDIE